MAGRKAIDAGNLAELTKDPVFSRLVMVVDIASLSILELLEYGFTRDQLDHALQKEIIAIDKATSQSNVTSGIAIDSTNVLVGGDYYFYSFLSSKVKLTELGLDMLDAIKKKTD